MLPAVGIPQSLLGRAIRAETPRHQIIFVDMLLYSPCFLSPTPPTFCAVAPFVITQPRQRENNGRKYNKKYLGVMARLDFPPFYRQVRYGVFLCVGVPISFMSSVLKGRERGGGASPAGEASKKSSLHPLPLPTLSKHVLQGAGRAGGTKFSSRRGRRRHRRPKGHPRLALQSRSNSRDGTRINVIDPRLLLLHPLSLISLFLPLVLL